jgi:hypothetical protein
VVGAFARDAMDNRLALPGRAVPPAELPAAVERARAFYASHHTPEDDCFGVVLVHQLPAGAPPSGARREPSFLLGPGAPV